MKENIQRIHEQISRGAQISTDSRQIKDNTIFFALKGENFDANDFALEVLKKGAVLSVTDRQDLPDTPGLIKVKDCLTALQKLASYHRMLFKIPIIGITGTNGKTTTKELISAVLAKKYRTHYTPGNYNNHIGLPLTLLQLNNTHEIAVIEMGANHMGEIDFLCNIASPNYGMITNTGKAHIEGFGSEENIVKTKTELYRFLQKKEGVIFVNGDNATLTSHCQGYKHLYSYGEKPDNHITGKILAANPFLQIAIFAEGKDKLSNETIHTQLIGNYNFENIMAAVAIGIYFEVPLHDIKAAIEAYIPNNSRSQYTDSGKNKIIWDAYNANPTSMKLALENFAGLQSAPKAIILGDMLELGHTAGEEHLTIAQLQETMQFQLALLIGEEFSKLRRVLKKTRCFANAEEAIHWLEKNPMKGYTTLIKGSRGIKLEKLRPYL